MVKKIYGSNKEWRYTIETYAKRQFSMSNAEWFNNMDVNVHTMT